MRKDFTLGVGGAPAADSASRRGAAGERTPGTFIVPIGPQHPALKEPGPLRAHRGRGDRHPRRHPAGLRAPRHRERRGRPLLGPQPLPHGAHLRHLLPHPLHRVRAGRGEARRDDRPAAGPGHPHAVRELERIHSHLLWLGVAAHEVGFDTLFMYSWRDRETVMDLLEELSGNRVNYSVNLLGGVKYDVDAARLGCRPPRRGLPGKAHDPLPEDRDDRRELPAAHAARRRDLPRAGGPAGHRRAHGPRLRGARATCAWTRPTPPTRISPCARSWTPGATWRRGSWCASTSCSSRYRLVREILDAPARGGAFHPRGAKVPEGEVISRVEAPRGELFYYLRSTGGVKPDRVKVRTPSLCNWAAVLSVVVGHKLADVPMILAGIDPCFSCNDRSVVAASRGTAGSRGRNLEQWSWERPGAVRHPLVRHGGGRMSVVLAPARPHRFSRAGSS